MPGNLIPAATTGLPTESLMEVHDCLTLALDATKGSFIPHRNALEARSYMRAALRQINPHLPQENTP